MLRHWTPVFIPFACMISFNPKGTLHLFFHFTAWETKAQWEGWVGGGGSHSWS